MKYIGSKSRLAKYIVPFLQEAIDDQYNIYWEPFCGGCNIIDKIQCQAKYASDGNKYLIEMWCALRDNKWEPPDIVTKEQYNAIKTLKDTGYIEDHVLGFIGHNCSFSGDWFAGYAGTGEDRNRCLEAKRHLEKQIQNLRTVDFYHANYNREDSFGFQDHVIYCDPPYYKGFKYKGSEFEFNHGEFWDWCRVMANHNKVFVSDYYAPDDFKLIWEKEIIVNAHQNKQKQKVERLYKL